jgi:hypothetical protein
MKTLFAKENLIVTAEEGHDEAVYQSEFEFDCSGRP